MTRLLLGFGYAGIILLTASIVFAFGVTATEAALHAVVRRMVEAALNSCVCCGRPCDRRVGFCPTCAVLALAPAPPRPAPRPPVPRSAPPGA
jgi:hypothetical protein